MLLKPERLCQGDTIGIVAPASPVKDPEAVDKAVDALNRLGFKVKLASHVWQRHGFLAGTDQERAGDLMKMFADPKVRGIICIRGGYGTARILGMLDYKVIRQNPKVFVGYSDITSLHCALLTRARLVSFHGPMLGSDFANGHMPDFTRQSFLRAVTNTAPLGSISQGLDRKKASTLRGGKATGRIVGGNLTVLCTMIGTPWQPSFRNRILFFEESGEQPYRIDRMLTQLRNCGLLQQVTGIAIGTNRNCEYPTAKMATEYMQTLAEVLEERLSPLKVPVVAGLPFGHVPRNATIPLGTEAILDADNADLILTESGVR